MDKLEGFYALAKAYCKYITETGISADSVPSLLELLMKLYVSAQTLPEPEPETDRPSSRGEKSEVRLGEQISPYYWTVSDPCVLEEPVCGSLTDDLSDIASDLQRGIGEYERGNMGNAAFEWCFGFRHHWGDHAVDAIRYLHSIKRG